MGKFKVTTPNDRFNGVRLGVVFKNGVGYTDEEKTAKYLKFNLHYKIEEEETPQPPAKSTSSKRQVKKSANT